MRRIQLSVALLVIVLDRITKIAIARKVQPYDSVSVIPHFFSIIHAENRGAAFGLFADSPSQWRTGFLVLFSVLALGIVARLLWKTGGNVSLSGIALSLILGGALGNLWDRLVSGRVVDFLLFYVKQYQWPAFNVADSAIVVGAGLLVYEILFAKSAEREKARV